MSGGARNLGEPRGYRRGDRSGEDRPTGGDGSDRCSRRSFIRGAAAGVGGLAVAGSGAGRTTVRYVVAGDRSADDLGARVARAGFSVEREWFEGRVLVVDDRPGRSARLAAVDGVRDAIADHRPSADPSTVTPGSLRAAAAGTADPAQSDHPTPSQGSGPDPPLAADRDDEHVGRQWDKVVTGAFEAHETATGEGTRIAIVDTGIQADHPDVADNLDRDASVRIVDGRRLPSRGQDGFGHGTFVAGVAAASNEGDDGTVGVAPDADLVSVSPSLRASAITNIIDAMEYTVEIGVDAANLSLGVLVRFPPRATRFIRRILNDLAVFSSPQTAIVIASGNNGVNVRPGGGRFEFPASARNALTVAATGPNDARTVYSTHGLGFVDLGAPGGGYETYRRTFCTPAGGDDGGGELTRDPAVVLPSGTAAGDACPLPTHPYPSNHIYGPLPPGSAIAGELAAASTEDVLSDDGHYGYLRGTSFAAPQVAGVVALVREVAPELPTSEIQQLLFATADDVGESRVELGAGRVNALRAVEAAAAQE